MAVINGTNGNDLIKPGAISPGVSGFPTALADVINGLEGNDNIDGGGGDDLINGDASFSNVTGHWNDTLDGGSGNDTLRGFDGNDTYIVDSTGDEIDSEINDSTGGVDTVVSSISISLLDFIDGFALEHLKLVGGGPQNGTGNDNNNTITGNGAANALDGGAGNDLLLGGSGSDLLIGGLGNDTVRGQDGNDILQAGPGADVRIGGKGNDTFNFNQGGLDGSVDKLRSGDGGKAFDGAGAANGDIFDVSGIDANQTQGGDQAFKFGGVGKGFLSIVNVGSDTHVRGNIDNDAAFELDIEIEDGAVQASAYKAADFIL